MLVVKCKDVEPFDGVLIKDHLYCIHSKKTMGDKTFFRLKNGRSYWNAAFFEPPLAKTFEVGTQVYLAFSNQELGYHQTFKRFQKVTVASGLNTNGFVKVEWESGEVYYNTSFLYTEKEYQHIVLQKTIKHLKRGCK